jgi:hypothetical protein
MTFNGLHGVLSQNIEFFITPIMRNIFNFPSTGIVAAMSNLQGHSVAQNCEVRIWQMRVALLHTHLEAHTHIYIYLFVVGV